MKAHATPNVYLERTIGYPCPIGTYGTGGVSCHPCPLTTWTTTLAQTACDMKFSFSYATESTIQHLYIPYGVSMINVKLWGAGGASNRDRNSNADIADSITHDRSADKSTLSSNSNNHQGSGYEESSSSAMHYYGQGGNYISSNISVSMNQNIWIVVGKGGLPAVDDNVDASAGAGAGGRSAVQLVRGSDEVFARGGEAGRAHSDRVDSRDCTKLHHIWGATYSRARGDTEVCHVSVAVVAAPCSCMASTPSYPYVILYLIILRFLLSSPPTFLL